jgi:predicted Zn-dependent protease with MMP-like domain
VEQGTEIQILTARDVDELIAECVEELPAWVLDRLGDCVIRVEAMPRSWPVDPTPHRITIYRARLLAHATTRAELRRLTRAELLRLVVERLELEAAQAVDLAEACL